MINYGAGTFAAFSQAQDDALRAAMTAITGAELTFAVPILQALLVIYVLVWSWIFATGNGSAGVFFNRLMRAGLVASFITTPMMFNEYVQTMVFDTIPNDLATAINGSGMQIGAAEQYDVVGAASDNLVASIATENTAWSTAAVGRSVGLWMANGMLKIMLGIMAAVWSIGRKFTAIVICFGPWMILTELFDRTRGLFDRWIGAIVGILAFQEGSSVLAQVMLQGEMQFMAQAHAQLATMTVDQSLGFIFHIVWFFVSDTITMIALPTICAFGGGVMAANVTTLAIASSMPGRAANAAAAASRATRRS